MTPSLKWSIGAFLALFIVVSGTDKAYAYGVQIVDVLYDSGTGLNTLTPTGASQVHGGFAPAIADGRGTDSFYWSGFFDLSSTTGASEWGHGGSYNGSFSSPNTPAWSISSTYIPNGGMEIPGHDTLYECITNLWSGATFYDVRAHSDTMPCVEYQWNGSAYTAQAHPGAGVTQIVSAVPLNKATVASSTSGSIGATVNINTAQWVQALAQNAGNWFLNITLTPPVKPNVLGGAFASGNSISFKFPINSSGTFLLATSTDLSTLGDYTMSMQIVQPSFLSTYFSWFGFSGTVLDATTTRFTVVNQTGFDALNASSTSIIDQFLASSSPLLIASCGSWTSFDLGDCLNLLFIPQPSTFSYILADVQGILLFAPWGYATRVVNIFSGTATSSLPLIAAGIPDPSNPHQYMMFHFDPNEAIAGAASLNDNIVDPVSGDPVMPGVRLIIDAVIALATISYIFYDLVGGRKHGGTHKTKLS